MAQKDLVSRIELFMFRLRRRLVQPKKSLERAKGTLKKAGLFYLRQVDEEDSRSGCVVSIELFVHEGPLVLGLDQKDYKCEVVPSDCRPGHPVAVETCVLAIDCCRDDVAYDECHCDDCQYQSPHFLPQKEPRPPRLRLAHLDLHPVDLSRVVTQVDKPSQKVK